MSMPTQVLAFGGRSRDPWLDDQPIRSPLFSDEQLARHAMSLADSQIVLERPGAPAIGLLRRLKDNARALGECYRDLSHAAAQGGPLSPASEWLVDNFHVLEENARQVRHDLPRSYFSQLPKLGPGFLVGHPRIFGIMWAYVAHTDSLFEPDQLARYVSAYEQRKALTLGELWAVAINLRILLIENARRQADQLVRATRDRRLADELADELLGLDGSRAAFVARLVPGEHRVHASRAFVVQLLRRLSGRTIDGIEEWLDTQLGHLGDDQESVIQADLTAQAAATVTMRNIFHSLRLVNDVNWEDWLEDVSCMEAELRTNPGYQDLDFATRNSYRSAIERLARGSGQAEIDVARAALTLAGRSPDDVGSDLGFWLVDDGLRQFETDLGYRPRWRERRERAVLRMGLPGYVGTLALTTAAVVAAALWLMHVLVDGMPGLVMVILGVLVAAPASELVLGLVNYTLSRLLPTTVRPALALRDGVPEAMRTLVVVPTMITSPGGIDELMDTLEVHLLGNDDGEIYFAAATDWADAPSKNAPNDAELLDLARSRIRALNDHYGDRFFLFHRERLWNPSEGAWMGWERKRGKLMELNAYLRGATDTSYLVAEGRAPGRFRYVITLDSDTRLPRDTAKKLVAKIAHPLNSPVVDQRTRRVIRGFSILQPRVTPSLPSPDDTSVFQEVYSTQRGLSPYAVAVSDVYQDLFGRGSFSGKGIYDIDALEITLGGRIPENAVLSHDLLEGNYARSGLVTDIEVVEEYPTSYEVDTKRQHRWIRGDWQLMPWILGRWEGLDALGVWKMVDNLRRSLVPVFAVTGFVITLAAPSWQAGAAWVGLMLLQLLLPSVIPLVPALLVPAREITVASKYRTLGANLAHALALAGLNFTFQAHRAAFQLDAVVRTLWRLMVSGRRLLEWTTAAAAAAQASGTLRRFFQQMATGMVPAVLALLVGAMSGVGQLLVALPVATAWVFAPLVAQRVSRRLEHAELHAGPDDLADLRLVARRTWGFFETFVTAQDHHLPPDNFQEDPEPRVAHRTSPTNIGLYLLAVISAHDFGWIGIRDAVDRLQATMDSAVKLEHHHGHLYNWYDTQTGEPLTPRYVSAVDSGNYVGHLLAVASFCRSWREDPANSHDPRAGLGDGVRLLEQALAELPADRWKGVERSAVEARAAAIRQAYRDMSIHQVDVDALTRFSAAISELRAQGELPGTVQHVVDSLAGSVASALRDLELDGAGRSELAGRLAAIEEQARWEFEATDFQFVYDQRRRMLSVGYNVDEAKLDDSTYDLLASEARLGSFVAIAKDDIPTRHWGRLGREVTAVGGGAALLSWSGSMFEYLMPMLVMRQPAMGLLATTCELAVQRQMQYARQVNCPVWGISEAGYHARDAQMNYQYSPFGVPGLGLVRGLSNNLVIAPYASGLASMINPGEAMTNYRRLTELGARGRYGFYEALDFTTRRLPEGQRFAIVRSFMAHHQGMTIVAIANVVFDGRMRERFHDEPMVKAAELLLEERAPDHVPISTARGGPDSESRSTKALVTPYERVLSGEAALAPNVQLMSNGHLSLTVTSSGAAWLRWKGLAITRWSAEPTATSGSDHFYIRDAESGQVWSPAVLPTRQLPLDYQVRFAEDRARFSSRLDEDLSVVVQHQVSPEADAVLRRMTLRNDGQRPRRLDVVSYLELVLGRGADDQAHPGFSKLFVHTSLEPEGNVLVATRRRRSPEDPEVWAAHFISVERGAEHLPSQPVHETDRRAFLGRGGDASSPAQLAAGAGPTGTTGYTLDPIFSLRQPIVLPPDERVVLDWWTVVAADRDSLLRQVDQHRSAGAAERLAMLAWTQTQVELRHLGIDTEQAGLFQSLAGRVLYPQVDMRAPVGVLASAGPQSDLWSMGISGDLPLLVVRIRDAADAALVREVVRAFEFWRIRRLAVDVVLLNEESTGYAQALQRQLEEAANSIARRTGHPDSTGRIFVVRGDQVSRPALDALLGAAAVSLLARCGSIAQQLLPPPGLPTGGGLLHPLPRPDRNLPSLPANLGVDLQFFNGLGGFTLEGDEYVVISDPAEPTPAPWTNVVANEQFGFLATAEGGGFTWWRNSRDNQLTVWRNDPVSNPVSEAIYVRDDDTGNIWSPVSAVADGGRHLTRHGFGYTTYVSRSEEMSIEQTVFVPLDDPVKISLVKLTNTSSRTMRLSISSYAEIVLGRHRDLTARHLVTEWDRVSRALFARNPYSVDYPDQVAFLDMGGLQGSWTGDRAEFLGPFASLGRPHAVTRREPLSGRVGPGLDPCLAMLRSIRLEPGAEMLIPVLLGAASEPAEARSLIAKYRRADLGEVLAGVRAHWRDLLGQVQVSTPEPSFDLMLNGWLLYQTMASRMLARVGYYQASGAYGFRDQLQDSMAVVLIDPALARQHLLRAAGRQFVEGDVQHWWLPATGAGVRTRISDDVVWLAHAAARYVEVTADAAVLDAPVGFLVGPALAEGQHEFFFTPQVSEQSASLYDHCVIALERAFHHGRFGLPLMGTGDWNDGMNRVGAAGDGESVWLGWFLHATLSAFLPLARARGDQAFVERGLAEQERLLAALEEAGWDGHWYRRAYFDDATPLGSSGRTECAIDGIVQSWAVLSGAALPQRATSAMDAMYERLVDHDHQLIRLFTGPFDVSEPDPGYIRAYPPGVRENGGQYTHGAIWSILAWAALGRDDRAGEAFQLINPVNHALDREAAERYRVEPYVLAADVYSVEPYAGRGGWTWYTGSSGWLYRAGLEAILGVQRKGEHLEIRCCLPPEWTEVSVLYRHGNARYDIDIAGEAGLGRVVVSCSVDDQPVPVVDGAAIVTLDRTAATHWVTVRLGHPQARV